MHQTEECVNDKLKLYSTVEETLVRVHSIGRWEGKREKRGPSCWDSWWEGRTIRMELGLLAVVVENYLIMTVHSLYGQPMWAHYFLTSPIILLLFSLITHTTQITNQRKQTIGRSELVWPSEDHCIFLLLNLGNHRCFLNDYTQSGICNPSSKVV